MGFIDLVNSFFGSFRDFASSTTEFKCSQCIKCKQCIKTLSNGEQVRLFTCPAVEPSICDDEYIDTLLPSLENGLTTEYLEAYNKNRDAIYNYLYSSPAIYSDLAIPLSFESCIPVMTHNELSYFYKATECSKFKPFIDSYNIVNNNDTLFTSSAPDIVSFEALSTEDKQLITQREGW